ncbi:MAG: nucleotidyltransferase domain-containing protein [Hyphomonadaceae bacterium]|nr:nucleotidyltransferase domain-containing protein [Hyphomonadaceae bacterium]
MSAAFKFTPDMPADKEAVIQSRLSAVEREFDIKFIFAIESGSRAWGFPSPDSDFDVRFVYAHKPSWYLRIAPERDVIELPLEDDWDINGWDIQKAIGLLMKPNPVLLEWLSSPIQYRWDTAACGLLQDFAEEYVRPDQCLTHYFHLAKRQWDRNIEGEARVNLKKYFYVLRPCLAIRWIRINGAELPPMNFQDLVQGTELGDLVQVEISKLLIAKAKSSEIGSDQRIQTIDELIIHELNWAQSNLPEKNTTSKKMRENADRLFRELIGYTPT